MIMTCLEHVVDKDFDECEIILKGLAMIFSGHENPLIFFRGKERYI